jgi:hypothetical protein
MDESSWQSPTPLKRPLPTLDKQHFKGKLRIFSPLPFAMFAVRWAYCDDIRRDTWFWILAEPFAVCLNFFQIFLCLRHNVFTLLVLTAGIVSYCLFALKDMFWVHPVIGSAQKSRCTPCSKYATMPFVEKIATDIYTFSELRTKGFTYVDKTDALYAMASGEVGKQFFIARPRRFGKSLAVSTLKSLFQGEREFFTGLAIEPKWDWSKKWPVIHLDMVIDLPNDIYIVEFKLDKPASEAMEQIKGKEYAGKYALSGKRITLIGISFSSEKRTIVEELVENSNL